jgi:transcriptional regulator with XRE-family HTH domain
MTDLNSELTELLRDMRHQAGLTQGELGLRLDWGNWIRGRHIELISAYENGYEVPTPELVGRWAAACGYTARLVVEHPEGYLLRWVVELNDGPQP